MLLPENEEAVPSRIEPAGHEPSDSPPDSDARSLDEAAVPAPDIPLHPLAGIFPIGDDASIRDLARRISGNVPIDPVILCEDKILDGAALYLACLLVGREPKFETYAGDDPVEYLIARRGPLSESQRAMAAARAANLQLGANQYSKGLPIGRASELLKVSSNSISRARFVLRHGTPDLISAVDCGRMAVSAAETECRRRARQAAKERNASAQAAAQAESPEQADRIAEANTAIEPNTSPRSPTMTAELTPEADGSTDQAGADLLDAAPALSQPVDAPEATIAPMTWLWPEYVPSIGVTAVIGRTTIVPIMAAKLAATVAAADSFPDDCKPECGNVLLASTDPSSQPMRDRVYFARADLTSPTYTAVDFLGPEADEFGLPIRHFFADLQRLNQKLGTAVQVKLIVIDYLSDYLGNSDLRRDIQNLGSALRGLQVPGLDRARGILHRRPKSCISRDHRRSLES